MKRLPRIATVAAGCLWLVASLMPLQAQDTSIIVASTTSTRDSGLFDRILPLFKARTGIEVKVVALGTGQALDTGRRGDADVLFVHAKAKELELVAQGFAVKRHDVMYNDFVLIGPKSDPAKVAGGRDIVGALQAIHAAKAPFVSRGDKSGTHTAELRLWAAAALEPQKKKPAWYREIGQGMGAALNMAKGLGAYVLADRGTWIAFKSRADMQIAVEGDKRLFNQYGIMLVNPTRHGHVKAGPGQRFIDWVVGPEGQQAIGAYKIDGQQLFFPNAAPNG